MTTQQKLLAIAAQLEQIHRELDAIGKDAPDISFPASHRIGRAMSSIWYAAKDLTTLSGDLRTNRP